MRRGMRDIGDVHRLDIGPLLSYIEAIFSTTGSEARHFPALAAFAGSAFARPI